MLSDAISLVTRSFGALRATSRAAPFKSHLAHPKPLGYIKNAISIPTKSLHFKSMRTYSSATENFVSQALQKAPVQAPRVAFSTKKRMNLDYWPFELDESDFLKSDKEANPMVLQEDSVGDPSPTAVSKSALSQGSTEEALNGDEERAGEPKTFDELFGAAYADHMRENGTVSDLELEKWQVSVRLGKIAEKSAEKGGLHHAESIFANLFKKQSQWQGEDAMMLHKVAREGWRSMLNGYVLQGTEEQLIWFMETYSAMYGLHELDRVLCALKFHLCHNDLAKAKSVWAQAVEDGLVDDRGYSLMAKGFSLLSDFETAFQILDSAWMKALADNQFKITPVFYQTSAEIFISALDLSRLTDLFIRLHANKPPLDARFFTVLFRALNSLTGISGRLSADHSKSDSTPSTRNIATLSKVFDMIEACLSKLSIQPSNQLRNEMLAFKLYAESDVSKMFHLLSQYATSPDSRTLNMMLDALIHEGKMQMASLLCDSWDAQFGVKMDRNSYALISNNLVEFCKLPIPSSVALVETNEGKERNSFSELYNISLPAMSLFDEFVLRRTNVELVDDAVIAFAEYLCKLEKKFQKPSPGASLLVSYIVSRTYDAQKLPLHSFFGVAQALFNHQNPLAAKQICDFSESVCKDHRKLVHLRSLLLQWSHIFEEFSETEARWKHWKSQKGAISATVATGFLRALSRHPFGESHTQFLADVLNKSIPISPTLFGAILRLMVKQPPKLRNLDSIFNLERIRQRKKIPLNANTASTMALITLIDSKRTLSSKQHAEVERKMLPFRNTEPATRYPLPLTEDETEQFVAAMEQIETMIKSATEH
jgi:chemotaxis protein CheY-P-specific phosphatase CheC